MEVEAVVDGLLDGSLGRLQAIDLLKAAKTGIALRDAAALAALTATAAGGPPYEQAAENAWHYASAFCDAR